MNLEQEIGLTEGNIFQGELTIDQLLFNRPFPGYAQYRMPVKNLYMCGSSTHPGGGVSCRLRRQCSTRDPDGPEDGPTRFRKTISTTNKPMNTADPYAGERLKESPFHPREAVLNIRERLVRLEWLQIRRMLLRC